MDPRLVHRLTTGEGWGLLQSLPPYREDEAIALQSRLRSAGFDPELVAAALSQSKLRAAATAKFTSPEEMLFTSDGLEQATRRQIATRHAKRLADAGAKHVYDLGCGLGADAMAFAEHGLGVTAVDSDETTAAIAAFNLRRWPKATVEHRLAEQVRIPQGEAGRSCAVWLDPARRTPGVADIRGRTRRLFRLEDLSPSWSQVRTFAEQAPAAGAKLAPAFPHEAIPPGAQAIWTSWQREVAECAVYFGAAVDTPGRQALILRPGLSATVDELDAFDARPGEAILGRLGGYLYEPDRAVLQAGLVGALINAVDGTELASGVGYVSSDRERTVPWASRFAITEAVPLNAKAVRAVLRDRDVDQVILKKRGVSVVPETFRRELRLPARSRGGRTQTVVLTRAGTTPVAIFVTPH